MIYDPASVETRDLRLCSACLNEAQARDRFCRRCGLALCHTGNSPAVTSSYDNTLKSGVPTAQLTGESPFHRVSGSLVRAIITGISDSAANYPGSRLMRRAMVVLLSVPIWLLIIFLSPLDAYAAARQISCR